MGILTDYFTVASDGIAAATAEQHGAIDPATGKTYLGTVELKGIDPQVCLGTLTEILTGVAYDDVTEDPRHAALLGDPEGETWVFTVTELLRDALATADPATLHRAAHAWAATEELEGSDPRDLIDTLDELAVLARLARENAQSMYCWTSL